MGFDKTIRSRRGRFGKDDQDFHKPKSPPPISNSKHVIQRAARSVPSKLNPEQKNQLFVRIKNYLDNNHNYYLGFGGMGDALLVLAACWNDPKSRVIFLANGPSLNFISEIFNLFKIELLISDNVMGHPIASQIFNIVTHHSTFKTSGHLADGLNHDDWQNYDKYISRIVKYVPWTKALGKIENNHIILCPSGSHKDHARQRYLSNEECRDLAKKHLVNNEKVYINVGLNDINRYWIDEPNCFILTSNFLKDYKRKEERITIKKMLQIINGAREIISMDTWIKTYGLLNDIPTTVIETRWNDKYKNFGEDITDYIFLNPKIWPKIKFQKIENLL